MLIVHNYISHKINSIHILGFHPILNVL